MATHFSSNAERSTVLKRCRLLVIIALAVVLLMLAYCLWKITHA